MKSVRYAPRIDSLMYAMVTTQPNIISSCRRSRHQIHAQSWPTTLERSQAYITIFGGHTRPWHPI